MDSSIIYQKFLDKALHFLSYRPRSEKEVRDNLVKRNAPPEIIDKITEYLHEQRFLNDEEFARWWLEQRSRFRQKGLRVIKMELKQKGIHEDVIKAVLLNPETEVVNDLTSAKKVAIKKLPRYRGLEKREIYQKLGAVLARKGFDWDTIKQAIDESLREE